VFRTLDIIMIGALIAGAAWTFKVKYDAVVAKEELVRLERRLQIEREAIDILKADWSLLTSPDRLEKLATRYHDDLQLDPALPEQIGTLDQIPDRAAPAEGEAAPDKSAAAAKPGNTPDVSVITGSVPVPAERPVIGDGAGD
jgi:cell division protein FtsL